MRRTIAAAAGAIAAIAFAPVHAEPAGPVAVELFTSQGCYSCPPAERYLGELAGRADVIALEWHVDYWDDLVYGGAGSWKDPFSSADATVRQYAYNKAIEGRRRAYTPQMIVDGRKGMVGSDKSRVEDAIRRARKRPAEVALEVAAAADGGIVVTAAGAEATLWRIDFLKTHVTEVLRGENKGKTLTSHHIVRARTKLGRTGAGPLASGAPKAGEGCAIVAQIGDVGPILAAAYCPGSAAAS